MARNRVIAGDYTRYRIQTGWDAVVLVPPFLSQHKNRIKIDSTTVQSYRLISSDHRKSAVSGIIRGLFGKWLFGILGMLVGLHSAKNRGVYTVSLNFYDGRRSLIEIGDKQYKTLIKCVF